MSESPKRGESPRHNPNSPKRGESPRKGESPRHDSSSQRTEMSNYDEDWNPMPGESPKRTPGESPFIREVAEKTPEEKAASIKAISKNKRQYLNAKLQKLKRQKKQREYCER